MTAWALYLAVHEQEKQQEWARGVGRAIQDDSYQAGKAARVGARDGQGWAGQLKMTNIWQEKQQEGAEGNGEETLDINSGPGEMYLRSCAA